MAIVLVGGSFDTILPEANTEIVKDTGALVAPSYYAISESVAQGCSITGILQIETDDTNTLEKGDEVTIKIASKSYANIVNDVSGNEVSLVNRLPLKTGTATIKRRFNICALTSDIEEGIYYLLPNNELLVVRNSFNNPYITAGELGGMYRDALSLEPGMEIVVNNSALSKVYSDLRGVADIYDVIFFERIRELKKLAMLLMMFPANDELNVEYDKILQSTRSLTTKDTETGEIIPETVTNSSWSW